MSLINPDRALSPYIRVQDGRLLSIEVDLGTRILMKHHPPTAGAIVDAWGDHYLLDMYFRKDVYTDAIAALRDDLLMQHWGYVTAALEIAAPIALKLEPTTADKEAALSRFDAEAEALCLQQDQEARLTKVMLNLHDFGIPNDEIAGCMDLVKGTHYAPGWLRD